MYSGSFPESSMVKKLFFNRFKKLLPLHQLLSLEHSRKFMLSAKLSFLFHPFEKNRGRNNVKKNFLQCGSSFYGIIIIQFLQMIVQPLFEFFSIHRVIATDPPVMGKVIVMWNTSHRIFPYLNIQFIGHFLHGVIHVIDGKMFAG